MTTNLERLRRVRGARQHSSRPKAELLAITPRGEESAASCSVTQDAAQSTPRRAATLEEMVAGEVIKNSGGLCYAVTHAYPLYEPRGQLPLGNLLARQPRLFAPLHPQFGLDKHKDFYGAAFIDTETTGLGGGAGVYAFMVGVGTVEEENFVVRQFFMRTPAEEPALLVALADLLAEHEMTVTFNGRTFDLPLLRTRYQQNRLVLLPAYQDLPLLRPDRGHLDLLHPARRLWRRRLQSCRLINLEQQILGLTRSADDVPSHLIPSLYTDYARTADASQMGSIFYHNREDIVSMVALAERLCAAFGDDKTEVLHGLDWLSLGCTYEAREEWASAEAAFRRALEELVDEDGRSDAFCRLGLLLKRQERWHEATEVWQLWLTSVASVDPTPYLELAKYCEWQIKDLEQAEMWTRWALHNLRSASGFQQTQHTMRELEHRLVRLRRKRG